MGVLAIALGVFLGIIAVNAVYNIFSTLVYIIVSWWRGEL